MKGDPILRVWRRDPVVDGMHSQTAYVMTCHAAWLMNTQHRRRFFQAGRWRPVPAKYRGPSSRTPRLPPIIGATRAAQ